MSTQEHAQPKAIPSEWILELDPEWITMWNGHGRDKQRADEVPIEEYRKNPELYSFTYPTWSGPSVFQEEEMSVPVTKPAGTVKVRVYSPEGPGPFPVHINTHGGGWVIGGLNSEAAWCRSVCNKLSIKVIDVDYRMAPDYPFPTAIYDFWEVLKWARMNASQLNVNRDSISIGGLSAGGHMSAVLSHMARDEGIPLKLALLVVPSTDLRWSIAEEPISTQVRDQYPSIDLYCSSPWGGENRMKWFMGYWIPDDGSGIREAARKDWMASPMLAPSFSSLPRTHIVTAEFDLSRDESHEYGEVLRANGNQVSMKCYKGMPHAFGHYSHPTKGLTQGRQYIDDTCEVIRDAHGLVRKASLSARI